MFAPIHQTAGTVTPYKFPDPAHGGGYDDLYFLGGSVYVAASNPTLDAGGANPNPAVDKIALCSNGTLTLTPVLFGNANASAPLSTSSAPAATTMTYPHTLIIV